MFTIENKQLKVSIQPKGAELASIFHKDYQLEYLWNADPEYWAKKSPVLFPIVGTLKNNTFFYQNQSYQLSRHGFARDKVFEVTNQTKTSITFSLTDDEETQKWYPFSFRFSVTYLITEAELSVTYLVFNEGKKELYFSVGGHPAFKLPLEESATYEDYELVFNRKENAGRWPITKDGLIDCQPVPFFADTCVLPLNKQLFKADALVFKHLQSNEIKLHSNKTSHGLVFDFTGFPFLGLWAAPGADFLCIEPWCGIADSADANQQLPNKEGINQLAAGKTFEVTWRVHLF